MQALLLLATLFKVKFTLFNYSTVLATNWAHEANSVRRVLWPEELGMHGINYHIQLPAHCSSTIFIEGLLSPQIQLWAWTILGLMIAIISMYNNLNIRRITPEDHRAFLLYWWIESGIITIKVEVCWVWIVFSVPLNQLQGNSEKQTRGNLTRLKCEKNRRNSCSCNKTCNTLCGIRH